MLKILVFFHIVDEKLYLGLEGVFYLIGFSITKINFLYLNKLYYGKINFLMTSSFLAKKINVTLKFRFYSNFYPELERLTTYLYLISLNTSGYNYIQMCCYTYV